VHQFLSRALSPESTQAFVAPPRDVLYTSTIAGCADDGPQGAISRRRRRPVDPTRGAARANTGQVCFISRVIGFDVIRTPLAIASMAISSSKAVMTTIGRSGWSCAFACDLKALIRVTHIHDTGVRFPMQLLQGLHHQDTVDCSLHFQNSARSSQLTGSSSVPESLAYPSLRRTSFTAAAPLS